MIVLESNNFLSYISDYLPPTLSENIDFRKWLKANPDTIYQLTDQFMVTVPSPRFKYYQNTDANEIKKNVMEYTNEVVNALGFF